MNKIFEFFLNNFFLSLDWSPKNCRWLQPVAVERHTRDIALLAHGTRGSDSKVSYTLLYKVIIVIIVLYFIIIIVIISWIRRTVISMIILLTLWIIFKKTQVHILTNFILNDKGKQNYYTFCIGKSKRKDQNQKLDCTLYMLYSL